eukprot:6201560-Pleurochrysis_carterae.AAC.2
MQSALPSRMVPSKPIDISWPLSSSATVANFSCSTRGTYVALRCDASVSVSPARASIGRKYLTRVSGMPEIKNA